MVRNIKNRLFKDFNFLVWLLLLASVGFLESCKNEEPVPVATYKKQDGVFICNEGNFTFGNASLSFFDPVKKEISNQVFFNANSFPVGDVLQSITIFEKKAFLVVNNSGKILVINVDDFTHQGTISGLVSPRYIVFESSEKAFVSDLYSKNIAVVNPNEFTITGSINLGCSSEQMLINNGFLYVTSWSYNNKIFKINVDSHVIIDSLELQMQPNSMVIDKNNKIWVLCDGGENEVAALNRIDPVSFEIEKTFLFEGTENSPTELKINGAGDSIFFINSSWNATSGQLANGVCKMNIEDDELPLNPVIPEKNRLFFALGIDPLSSIIYVSDAKDFMQRGWIYRFKTTGEQIDSFKVDIVPGDFCFKNK